MRHGTSAPRTDAAACSSLAPRFRIDLHDRLSAASRAIAGSGTIIAAIRWPAVGKTINGCRDDSGRQASESNQLHALRNSDCGGTGFVWVVADGIVVARQDSSGADDAAFRAGPIGPCWQKRWAGGVDTRRHASDNTCAGARAARCRCPEGGRKARAAARACRKDRRADQELIEKQKKPDLRLAFCLR